MDSNSQIMLLEAALLVMEVWCYVDLKMVTYTFGIVGLATYSLLFQVVGALLIASPLDQTLKVEEISVNGQAVVTINM